MSIDVQTDECTTLRASLCEEAGILKTRTWKYFDFRQISIYHRYYILLDNQYFKLHTQCIYNLNQKSQICTPVPRSPNSMLKCSAYKTNTIIFIQSNAKHIIKFKNNTITHNLTCSDFSLSDPWGLHPLLHLIVQKNFFVWNAKHSKLSIKTVHIFCWCTATIPLSVLMLCILAESNSEPFVLL